MTEVPVWVAVAFQALVIFWSPGNVHFSVQPWVAAVPLFVTTTWPWNPPCQLLVTEYAAEQPEPAGGVVGGCVVGGWVVGGWVVGGWVVGGD